MSTLHVPDPDDRGDLGTFVGRVVRLDQTAVVRLCAARPGRVTAWAGTPFDVLATRTVPGTLEPGEVTTPAAALLSALTERGLAVAREHAGPMGPPASLLDQTVLTVSGNGPPVRIPLRCLFALSGMGFVGASEVGETVRVSATPSWLRLDARYGAVVRRRITALPLLT